MNPVMLALAGGCSTSTCTPLAKHPLVYVGYDHKTGQYLYHCTICHKDVKNTAGSSIDAVFYGHRKSKRHKEWASYHG